jgi:hypothetical protein
MASRQLSRRDQDPRQSQAKGYRGGVHASAGWPGPGCLALTGTGNLGAICRRLPGGQEAIEVTPGTARPGVARPVRARAALMGAEVPLADPAGPGADPAAGGLLDRRFDARGLSLLRAVVLAHAVEAGMPASRARDVMLAAHELAANAVRHGAGTGRLQMRAGTGCCACRSMMAARRGRDRWPGRAGHPRRRGRRVAAPVRSWPVGGAAGRRPGERLAGAGRDGGDGGLCAARCGSTALPVGGAGC